MSGTPNKSDEDRIKKFKDAVEALNKQFLGWMSEQVKDKPSKMLTAGVSDYVRHSAKLRLAFSDVIADGTGEDEASPAAPGSDSKKRQTYAPLLSLMPSCHTKTVHFIRHGEGWHNVGLANADAHLTDKGWQQASALRKHMLKFDSTRGVQLVIVSPLMRTLETAAGVFGELSSPVPMEQDTASNNNNNDAPLLMVAQTEVREVRAAHPAVHARPGLQYRAHELCRERMGPSACDSRRPQSESALAFPCVDFTMIQSDEDPHWHAGIVEEEAAVATRGRQFLQYIMSLEETNIAVVTHSAFLWFSLAMFGGEAAKPVRDKLQRWYENCEMRTVVLSDAGGSGVLDETHFPGGHAAAEPQQTLMEQNGGGGGGGGDQK